VALSNLIPTQETELHQTVSETSLWDMESEALPPLQREGQREDEMEFLPPTGAS
jgi:hypothetical protein